MEEIRICIIGKGNVAWHLKQALSPISSVESVSSRNISGIPQADLYLIAVADDAIIEVVRMLPSTDSIVAHTSGSVSIGTLGKFPRRGVFYPLQTLSKDIEIDYSGMPILIEGSSEMEVSFLKKIASMISSKVKEVNSADRARIHLAAVIASNFSNHLLHLSSALLPSDVPTSILLPLLEETLKKAAVLTPFCAQTGPARRGDKMTVEKHLKLLSDNPELKSIYSLVSRSIFATYHPEKL